jgi:hypothetical protein
MLNPVFKRDVYLRILRTHVLLGSVHSGLIYVYPNSRRILTGLQRKAFGGNMAAMTKFSGGQKFEMPPDLSRMHEYMLG